MGFRRGSFFLSIGGGGIMCRHWVQAFMAVLLSVALSIAADKPEEDPKQEIKKLQGRWQVTKFIDHSEEPAPTEEIKHFTFEFKEDRLTMRKDKEDDGKPMKFTLNPSKQPKWMNIDMGAPIGVAKAIYKLDGDELTMCVVGGTRKGKAAPRPSEFKPSKRDKYSLFVLKKIKN